MFKQIKDDSYTELKDGKYKLKDGWILPIISSLSHFVDYKTMKVNLPNDDVIRGIMAVIYKYGYKTEQNVQTLGKSSASYSFILDLLQTNFDFVSEGKQVFK